MLEAGEEMGRLTNAFQGCGQGGDTVGMLELSPTISVLGSDFPLDPENPRDP